MPGWGKADAGVQGFWETEVGWSIRWGAHSHLAGSGGVNLNQTKWAFLFLLTQQTVYEHLATKWGVLE